MSHDVSSMHQDWRHSIERKQFAREIIQPRINGLPNPEFIKSYPEHSKEYFNQEQIDEALRRQV